MKKITFEDEVFYFDKGVIYDDSFLEVPRNISQKVLANYYKHNDYKTFEEAELLDFIKI